MMKLITYVLDWRCNSKCITCELWKNPPRGNLLDLNEIRKLFSGHRLKTASEVYLTGGEPFLREDLPEIASIINTEIKQAVIGITTNCLSPEMIIKKIKVIREKGIKLSISLSLTGDRDTHDRVRGSSGNFDKVQKTLSGLFEIGLKPAYLFTIFPFNIGFISEIYNLSKSQGINTVYEIGRSDSRFGDISREKNLFSDFDKEKLFENLKKLITLEPGYKNFYQFVREYFSGEYFFICTGLKERIYIDPFGNIFPCDGYLEELKIGNIREKEIDEILSSERAKYVLNTIKRKACQPCGISCDLWASYRDRKTVASRMISKLKWILIKP